VISARLVIRARYDIIYDIIVLQAHDIMYDIIVLQTYDIMFFYMIYYMISYLISVRLQPPILPRHSALVQTMVGMSVMLTWTDQWMPTRSVTMLGSDTRRCNQYTLGY
jgi:hypothetical protein